jgi:hypothetical protein
MRRTIPFATVAAALLAAWVSYGFAQAARQGGGKPSQVWEYRVIVLADVVNIQQALQQGPGKTASAVESKFNELGQGGWEYCGDLHGTAVFKRPKP